MGTYTGKNSSDTFAAEEDGQPWLLFGKEGDDRLLGKSQNDTIYGDEGNDTLIGGPGLDTLNGGYGNDRIFDTDGIVDGGANTDTLIADYSEFDNGSGVEVAFQNQNAIFSRLTGRSVLKYSNIEQFDIRGTKYNDVLRGTAGDDILNGGAGDDLLFGSPGNDTFRGGDGTDTLVADYSQVNNGAGIEVAFKNQNAIFSRLTGERVLSYSDIERFEITGTQYVDVLRGTADINILNGGAGDDVLIGKAGNDTLNGGDGNDRITATNGIVNGGAGTDTLVADYSQFDNGFGVDVAFQRQNAIFSRSNGDNPVLNYSNIERFEITGTKYNDVLRGTAGDDILNGGDGDDLLFGSPGNDTFRGGDGTDTLIADYSQFNNGAGVEVVFQNQNAILSSLTAKSVLNFSNIERFEITGTQYGDVLRGAAGNDILNGGAADDALFGGAGNDTLNGGAGNDILTGSTGADQFVFNNSKVEGLDVIKDFSRVEGDKIQISKIGFGITDFSGLSYNNGALLFQGTQFATLENKPANFAVNLDIQLI